MIYTITLQPTIDYYLEVDSLNQEVISHIPHHFEIGGKGINVSRVIHALGGETTCLFLASQNEIGLFSKEFNQYNIPFEYIETTYPPRLNVKIVGNENYELNVDGHEVLNNIYIKLRQFVLDIPSNSTIVLSGSSGSSICKPSIYTKLIELRPDLKWVVDCKENDLASVLSTRPFLIKPNFAEIRSLMNKDSATIDEALDFSRSLSNETGINILLTLGEKGSYWIDKNNVIFTPIEEGTVYRTTGCGDCFLGSFLLGIEKNLTTKDALAFATHQAYLWACSINFSSYFKECK